MVASLLKPSGGPAYGDLARASLEVRRAGTFEDLRGYLASLENGVARAKADEALGHRLDMLLTSNVIRYAEFVTRG